VVRRLLFLLAFLLPELSPRYDCELDQWNFCEEFNFEDHGNSAESDSDEDVGEFFDNLARSRLEDVPMNEAPDPEVLEKEEHIRNDDALQLDGSHQGFRDPEDDGGTHLGHTSQVPFFCNDTVVKFLGDNHFRFSERDIAGWRDASDFLANRYGLTEPSGTEDQGKNEVWARNWASISRTLTNTRSDSMTPSLAGAGGHHSSVISPRMLSLLPEFSLLQSRATSSP